MACFVTRHAQEGPSRLARRVDLFKVDSACGLHLASVSVPRLYDFSLVAVSVVC
jgi:hypothetical protein